jgi:hypothetical protein
MHSLRNAGLPCRPPVEAWTGLAGIQLSSSLFESIDNILFLSLHPCFSLQSMLGAKSQRPLKIIEGASGVLRPGRFTLVLAPPGSGKTTLLRALSGRLREQTDLHIGGSVLYNGRTFDEFIPERSAAYISQVCRAEGCRGHGWVGLLRCRCSWLAGWLGAYLRVCSMMRCMTPLIYEASRHGCMPSWLLAPCHLASAPQACNFDSPSICRCANHCVGRPALWRADCARDL